MQAAGTPTVVDQVESSRRQMEPETFPASPQCVSWTRHKVKEFLGGDVPPKVVEVAVLLVSELATNAVRHAHSPFTVTAELLGETVTVEVDDANGELPQVLQPAPSSAVGRGMFMIEALSSRWGAERIAGGKRVWFQLALT
jgi:anti-sigma regulatory factor (Ser/Thr protein kinase)